MAYRDEAEALRARLELLERENGALRRENDVLRGARPALRPGGSVGERLLGAPVVVVEDREIEGELPASGHEAVLEVLRTALGAIGEANVVGATLTWRLGPPATQRIVEVMVSARDGRTRVRIVERLGSLAGGLFGGVVGGAGGGGLGVMIPLLAMVDPLLAAVAAPLWVGAIYGIVRAGYARAAERRAREVAALADEAQRVVQRAVTAPGAPRVRVVETGEPDRAELDRAELEQERAGQASRAAARRGER